MYNLHHVTRITHLFVKRIAISISPDNTTGEIYIKFMYYFKLVYILVPLFERGRKRKSDALMKIKSC